MSVQQVHPTWVGWTTAQLEARKSEVPGRYECPLCTKDCRTPEELRAAAEHLGLKRFAPRRGRKDIEERAFRFRAGTIGLLSLCDCAYPLELANTSTGHDVTCRGNGATMAALTMAEHRGEPPPATLVVEMPAPAGPLCSTCRLPTEREGNCDECQLKIGGIAS